MEIKFRQARISDIDAAVPLIYSSGPDAFEYIFSVMHLNARAVNSAMTTISSQNWMEQS